MGNLAVNAGTYPTDGYVTVTWTNSGATGSHYAWQILRRVNGESTWEVIHTNTGAGPNFTYFDVTAPANTDLEYSHREVTSTDGGQTLVNGTPTAAIDVTTTDSKYWLLHPTDDNLNFQLEHVTSDSFTDESEEAVLNVIGRGRKVDRGEEWGITGQLTVKFRNTSTATGRQQWKDFLALKRSATFLYLRNPFGDVYKVVLGGSPSTDREPGIGSREHHTVTVPYMEVA